MALTPRDRRILADIESDLREDTDLDTAMSTPPEPFRLPVSPARVLLLVSALTVLACVHTVVADPAVPVTGVLTVLLVGPWVVDAARRPR